MSATAKRIIMHSVPLTPAQQAINTIPGGFIIKARKIEESEIAHAAPVIREIWDWLLMQANHKDNPTLNIRRGQCVRKIADIQDGLHWFVGYRKETYSKTQCENALEWLRKRQMITTTKTTRGLIITICKYDSYNRIENYEYNSEDSKKTTRRQQQGGTINKNGNNENNEKDSLGAEAPPPPEKSYKELTEKEFSLQFIAYQDKYPREMLLSFFKYWKEKNAKGKMRFQLEKTWELDLRQEYWARRNEEQSGFKGHNDGSAQQATQKEKLPSRLKQLKSN